EVIGKGTLLSQVHLMFGDASRWLTVTVIDDYKGFLLVVLPPGAFICLGLLIALKNVIDSSLKKQAVKATAQPISPPLAAHS
ncbi:MAG: electron transport complex protein RnfE, partial [Halothiobacillaceae bacterium]